MIPPAVPKSGYDVITLRGLKMHGMAKTLTDLIDRVMGTVAHRGAIGSSPMGDGPSPWRGERLLWTYEEDQKTIQGIVFPTVAPFLAQLLNTELAERKVRSSTGRLAAPLYPTALRPCVSQPTTISRASALPPARSSKSLRAGCTV